MDRKEKRITHQVLLEQPHAAPAPLWAVLASHKGAESGRQHIIYDASRQQYGYWTGGELTAWLSRGDLLDLVQDAHKPIWRPEGSQEDDTSVHTRANGYRCQNPGCICH